MIEYWVDLCDERGNHGAYYSISSKGKVLSKERKVRTKGGAIATRPPKLLTPCRHKTGYLVVGLTIGGSTKQRLVSRLMAFSFYGQPASVNNQACHNNGIRTDNRVNNIRWGTPLENAADKVRHGRNNQGSSNPRTSLDEADVRDILHLIEQSEPQHQIAKLFKISPSAVNHIAVGRTWKHIERK